MLLLQILSESTFNLDKNLSEIKGDEGYKNKLEEYLKLAKVHEHDITTFTDAKVR